MAAPHRSYYYTPQVATTSHCWKWWWWLTVVAKQHCVVCCVCCFATTIDHYHCKATRWWRWRWRWRWRWLPKGACAVPRDHVLYLRYNTRQAIDWFCWFEWWVAKPQAQFIDDDVVLQSPLRSNDNTMITTIMMTRNETWGIVAKQQQWKNNKLNYRTTARSVNVTMRVSAHQRRCFTGQE